MTATESIPKNASWSRIYKDFVGKEGQIGLRQVVEVDTLRRYTNLDYPGWNMRVSDAQRIDVFLREFKQFQDQGQFPNLVTLYLPQNHTSGTSADSPTPAACVADNDLALGRVVEAISQSKFWKTTCLFVVEDDPQNGFDHVDGHRSVCLVISPYTRRGQVVSAFYNQTAVLHTIEQILGLPPMNQLDAMAPVMRECFTENPDVQPYKAMPNTIALDQMNPAPAALAEPQRHWEKLSAAQNFAKPDRADEDTLNRILWHAMRGAEVRYPSEWAGAHGKGLGALRLKLQPDAKDGDDD